MSERSGPVKSILKQSHAGRTEAPGEADSQKPLLTRNVRFPKGFEAGLFEHRCPVKRLQNKLPSLGDVSSVRATPSKAFFQGNKSDTSPPARSLAKISVTGRGRDIAGYLHNSFLHFAAMTKQNPGVLPGFLCEGSAEHLKMVDLLAKEVDSRLGTIATRNALILLSHVLEEHYSYHSDSGTDYNLSPRSVKLVEDAVQRLPEDNRRLVLSIMYKQDGSLHEPKIMTEKLSFFLLRLKDPLAYDVPNFGKFMIMSPAESRKMMIGQNRESLKKCLRHANAVAGEANAAAGQLHSFFSETYQEEMATMKSDLEHPRSRGKVKEKTVYYQRKLSDFRDWDSSVSQGFEPALQRMNNHVADGFRCAFYLDSDGSAKGSGMVDSLRVRSTVGWRCTISPCRALARKGKFSRGIFRAQAYLKVGMSLLRPLLRKVRSSKTTGKCSNFTA